ncbi:restriction endonuclease [Polaromonas sp.]|nr:restriction endonuclease [Candidatus Saccharibacteria bacterium]
MSRRLSPSPMPVIFITAAWLSQEPEQRALWMLRVAEMAILILLSWATVKLALRVRSRSRLKESGIDLVDTMDGLKFEHYIKLLLERKGFYGVKLTERFDLGVDVIATKDNVTWGIQVKRYSGMVRANAVRQAVTALNYYKCDRAMVISNSFYSKPAKQLAASNGCLLSTLNYPECQSS